MWYQELSSTLKLSILERAASPLLGTFTFIWLAFNWEPLLIIVFQTELTVIERIAYVKNPVNCMVGWGTLLLYPLGVSLGFILF